MTDWKLAMALLLPLMTNKPKIRTWAAMMGASLAAMFVVGADPYAYLAIDLLAAGLVLARPAGLPQRAIGALFGCMCFFHIGFVMGGQHGVPEYLFWNTVVGWTQWAVLLCWGAYDLFGHRIRRSWDRRNPAYHKAGSRR